MNRQQQAAPMVVLELTIPSGFALVADGLSEMLNAAQLRSTR